MKKAKTKRDIRGLYAITPDLADAEQVLLLARQACEAGVNILQYRNKTLNQRDSEKLAAELQQICRQNGQIFIINDDVHLAAHLGADGVHLGADDTELNDARQLLPSAVIGISCYNQLNLAEKAQRDGADYVAFGRFYTSKTKPHAVLADLSLLKHARESLQIPCVAIGGITPDNAKPLIQHGASAIAVIDSLFSATDIAEQTARFNTVFSD